MSRGSGFRRTPEPLFVAVEALAAGMLLLVLLDVLTRFVGRLY